MTQYSFYQLPVPQVSRKHRVGSHAVQRPPPGQRPRSPGRALGAQQLQYLADVDGLVAAAGLHQEFVGKDSIV